MKEPILIYKILRSTLETNGKFIMYIEIWKEPNFVFVYNANMWTVLSGFRCSQRCLFIPYSNLNTGN